MQTTGTAHTNVWGRPKICLQASLTDLPLITFEIGFAKERKTIVNYFYREFTNGVTGSRASQDQLERLTRMTNYWRSLTDSNKDVVCLGDANLCAVKWNDADYHMKEHAEVVQMFLLETESTQLVKNFTRSEFVQGGVLSRSLIDHCYSNAADKVSTPEVIAVGNSDHLGVVLTKYTRAPKPKPKVVMKRSYKHFKTEDFLNDINSCDINADVTCENSLEHAATKFEVSFRAVLDRHAPIRVFQMRK